MKEITPITPTTPLIDISSIEIDPANNTMKSTDLHEIVRANTGMYALLANFHKKVKNSL